MTVLNTHTKTSALCTVCTQCPLSAQFAHITLPQIGTHFLDSINTTLLLCMASSITYISMALNNWLSSHLLKTSLWMEGLMPLTSSKEFKSFQAKLLWNLDVSNNTWVPMHTTNLPSRSIGSNLPKWWSQNPCSVPGSVTNQTYDSQQFYFLYPVRQKQIRSYPVFFEKYSQGPSSHYSLRIKTAAVTVLLLETQEAKQKNKCVSLPVRLTTQRRWSSSTFQWKEKRYCFMKAMV